MKKVTATLAIHILLVLPLQAQALAGGSTGGGPPPFQEAMNFMVKAGPGVGLIADENGYPVLVVDQPLEETLTLSAIQSEESQASVIRLQPEQMDLASEAVNLHLAVINLTNERKVYFVEADKDSGRLILMHEKDLSTP